MSSMLPPLSRRGARVVLAASLLAMIWYGYYQVGSNVRLLLLHWVQVLG
jgi:hypothetical protein